MKCVVRTVSHNATRMNVVWLVVSVWGCVCGAPTRGHIFTLCICVCTTCILCDSQLYMGRPTGYRLYIIASPPGAPLSGGCAFFLHDPGTTVEVSLVRPYIF